MKTLLLLLLMASNAFALSPAFLGNMKVITAPAADACSTCPSDAEGGDMICEDWESTGSLCTGWVETTTNCTTLDDDATHTGTWATACTDIGSHALKIKYTNDAGACYTKKNATSAVSYIQFYLNVTDIGTLASGSYQIFALGNDTSTYVYLKVAYHSASQYHLQLNYYNTGASYSTVTGATLLDLDKYYRINIYIDSATNTLNLNVSGSPELPQSDLYSYGTMKYYYFGNIGDAQAGAEFEADMFKVDNDTEPAECAL